MRLYNTLTRQVEELLPDDVRSGARPFRMYVCGPTVQDVPHFGHARAALVPDVLRRYLEWRGIEVLHVRNITDVDDKIIARAAEEGRDPAAVAETYARIYEEQMARLGILPPHIAPRATGHITDMIELAEQLVATGHAYEAGGDVFFSVRSFPEYGRLSGRDLDDLRAGARVELDERKRDPLDFVLWKAAKPGEPSWPSPWGRGRPGWHLECSAMVRRYLGDDVDLHAGGTDLIFPHHENEIAQAEAATGTRFVRHWMHNGLLHIDSEKMSKSLGNFITLQEALDEHGGGTLRLYYLMHDYRSVANFSAERIAETAAAWQRLRAFAQATRDVAPAPPVQAHLDRAVAAMEDDLGTPAVVALLFELVSAGHAALAERRADDAAALRATFDELSGMLGLDLTEDEGPAGVDLAPLVETLLSLREEARAARDFATADRIRDACATAGIVVEDTPDGPRWRLER